ncbi:MAG TPA: hypothetical protein VI072_30935 [Polyangiaceae bacterium]
MNKFFTFCGALIAVAGPAALACGPVPPPGTGGAGGTGGAPPTGGPVIPCNVLQIMANKCQTCHSNPPQYGAPMPLTTLQEVQTHRERMIARVEARTMPPNTTLSDADRNTLVTWLRNGAQGVAPSTCVIPGDDDRIGPEYLPCPDSHRITMRTYAGAEGSGTKYSVATGQRYVNFSFRNPFRDGELSTDVAPLIDNKSVIHHFILYGIGGGGGSGRTHVSGWAPGGTNGNMPPDVGLMLDYDSFTMEVHYSNATGGTQLDSSGVVFCTNRNQATGVITPRQYTAGIFTLGQYLFSIPAGAQNHPVTAQCNVQRPMTIIGTSPHMHQLGWGFRTEHIRGGNLEDLSNIPDGQWSFDGQRHYGLEPRRQVNVGDILRTTCRFRNPNPYPVNFGTRTEDEMCFDFMTVIPYTPLLRSCTGAAAP